MSQPNHLGKAIARVVDADNCSGCGGCLLASARVQMSFSDQGYMRPTVSGNTDRHQDRIETAHFRQICPGRNVTAPHRHDLAATNEVFGTYLKAWTAYASDTEIRHHGSSGGVLTAVQLFMLQKGGANHVVGTAMSSASPSTTVPVKLNLACDVRSSAGSRYAPSATLAAVDSDVRSNQVVVCKPCEASALRAHLNVRDTALSNVVDEPLILSFFCAGVPSQTATDRLVTDLGIPSADVRSVKYRGDGWPGQFSVESTSGSKKTMSYDESWGSHLGKTVQWRCKICVDGTGGHADISVGDYWESDERGFPVFENADGNSILLARTARGLGVIEQMIDAGVLNVNPVTVETAEKLQPLQTLRKRTLAGRLAGRVGAGYRIPIYRGYGLTRLQFANPKSFPRAFMGTLARSRQSRKKTGE